MVGEVKTRIPASPNRPQLFLLDNSTATRLPYRTDGCGVPTGWLTALQATSLLARLVTRPVRRRDIGKITLRRDREVLRTVQRYMRQWADAYRAGDDAGPRVRIGPRGRFEVHAGDLANWIEAQSQHQAA